MKGTRMPSTTPQDHKSSDTSTYKFKTQGKTWTLPAPSEADVQNLPGRYMRNAAMGGDNEQAALAFALLESMKTEPGTIDALYDLPFGKMMEHLSAWMTAGDLDGASLGESSASSD